MYHKVIIVKISMKKVIAPIAQKCAGKVNETWPYISADNIHKLVYFEIFRNTYVSFLSTFQPQTYEPISFPEIEIWKSGNF